MTQENHFPSPQQPLQVLPNSTTVLVLGILSIFCFCLFMGFMSMVMGIIALVLSKQSINLYNETPRLYTQASNNNLNTGRTCAIVGIVLSGITITAGIIVLLFGLGVALTAIPFCL